MQANPTPTAVPRAVRMTADQWKKTHRDFKGTYQGQRYVLQMTAKGTAMVPVQIIKEKQ